MPCCSGSSSARCLFETSPYDASVFMGAAGLLAVIALMASLAPAIRASRVDPDVALRVE